MEQLSTKSQTQLLEVWRYIQTVSRGIVPYPDWQDVSSEVFVDLLRGFRGGFNGESSLKTYAYKIVHRRIIDWMRKKMAKAKWQERNAGEFIERNYNRPVIEIEYESKELFRIFMEGLYVCSPQEERAVKLKYLEGLSSSEGAKRLGVSKSRFSSCVNTGLRKMIKRFTDEMSCCKKTR